MAGLTGSPYKFYAEILHSTLVVMVARRGVIASELEGLVPRLGGQLKISALEFMGVNVYSVGETN